MMMNRVHSFIIHDEQHPDFGCYSIIHKTNRVRKFNSEGKPKTTTNEQSWIWSDYLLIWVLLSYFKNMNLDLSQQTYFGFKSK